MIPAIKLTRDLMDEGLFEAKRRVDAICKGLKPGSEPISNAFQAIEKHVRHQMTDAIVECAARILYWSSDGIDGWDSALLYEEHSGDCTNECHTCQRCLMEKYQQRAVRFLEGLQSW